VGDAAVVTDALATKNVGRYFSSLVLSGADAKNYQVTVHNANLTITPYVIQFGANGNGPSIMASAQDKTFDASTAAIGSLSLKHLFAGDLVGVDFTRANFASANSGNNLPVTFEGIVFSGPDAANYALDGSPNRTPVTALANIYPVPQNIDHLVVNRINDQKTPLPSSTPRVASLERSPLIKIDARSASLVLTQLDENSQVTDILLFSKAQDFVYALQGERWPAQQLDVRFTATLIDGRPLPAWLKLDQERGTVSADVVPLDSLPIQYRINRIVQGNVQDSRDFGLNKSPAR
jgi:hypothetical protein